MTATTNGPRSHLLAGIDELLPRLVEAYKDIQSRPELTMEEHRIGEIAARHLREHGHEVTCCVGGTGVVGVLRNGEGPTLMLRADMDALPMRETTDLDYASKVIAKDSDGNTTSVAHSCGHDMHVAWLMGQAPCSPNSATHGVGRCCRCSSLARKRPKG